MAAIPGVALILIILWDAFETIILPAARDPGVFVDQLFYSTIWSICSGMVRAMHNRKRRDKYLATFGPLSPDAAYALGGLPHHWLRDFALVNQRSP